MIRASLSARGQSASLADAASFVVVAAIVARMPVVDRRHTQSRSTNPTSHSPALRDWPYLTLTLINSVMAIHMTLLSVGMPLWIAQHTRAPRAVVAPLLVVNTVLAILFQVRASKHAGTVIGSARCLARSGIAQAACCLLLAASAHVPMSIAVGALLASMLALTAGELLQSAGGWGLSYALAPAARQGDYLSVFSLGLTAQQIVGPVLITSGIIVAGSAGWIALGSLLLAVSLTTAAAARWAENGRASRARSEPEALPAAHERTRPAHHGSSLNRSPTGDACASPSSDFALSPAETGRHPVGHFPTLKVSSYSPPDEVHDRCSGQGPVTSRPRPYRNAGIRGG